MFALNFQNKTGLTYFNIYIFPTPSTPWKTMILYLKLVIYHLYYYWKYFIYISTREQLKAICIYTNTYVFTKCIYNLLFIHTSLKTPIDFDPKIPLQRIFSYNNSQGYRSFFFLNAQSGA